MHMRCQLKLKKAKMNAVLIKSIQDIFTSAIFHEMLVFRLRRKSSLMKSSRATNQLIFSIISFPAIFFCFCDGIVTQQHMRASYSASTIE